MQEDSLSFDQPAIQPVRMVDETAHARLQVPLDENYPLVELRNEHFLGQIMAGRYRLDHVIGSGGMSVVFSGFDVRTQNKIAVKLMHRHLKSQQKCLQRFQQEGKTLSKLNHINIVKVLAYGVHEDSTPYLVMEYVEGVNLSTKLGLLTKLSIESTLTIAVQVCSALEHAHRARVIHRDLKPSNIMIQIDDNGDEVVKIVDFGIAKIVSETQVELTGTGEVFGSPMYMSPEQCGGLAVDRRTDFYSLGCIIYECLVGFPPISGDSALATMMNHQHQEPLTLQEASMGEIFPRELERIVKKMLAKPLVERYANASTLSSDLMNVKINGYAAVAPSVVANPALDIFKSLQVDAAARVGFTQEAIDERSRRAAKNNSSGVVLLFVYAVGVIASIVLFFCLPSTMKIWEHTSYSSEPVADSTDPQQSDFVKPITDTKAEVTTRKFFSQEQEDKTWSALIAKRPSWLKLSYFEDLTNWQMLSHLNNLKGLDASTSDLKASDFIYLKKLPLRTLDLHGLKVSSGLDSLGSISTLQSLNLSQTDVSNSDLGKLNQNLRDLSLDNCLITNTGLKELIHLKRLKNLSLSHIPLSNREMAVLGRLDLESLTIHGCAVTPEALSDFKRLRTNCIIVGE